MSDDKELIAEARQEESIQDKLGDGFGEGSEERAFYYEHRDRYKRLADALAARQPTEGDREAIASILSEHGAGTYLSMADAIIARWPRSAVPDAATEAKANAKIADLVYENASLKAERDAALAAIERVRAIHEPITHPQFPGDKVYCRGCAVAVRGEKLWPCDTRAELDGAPEPEWEYGMQDDYGLSFVRNIAEAYDHANRQDPELNPRPVRRRKAGPWLPVEGESKP